MWRREPQGHHKNRSASPGATGRGVSRPRCGRQRTPLGRSVRGCGPWGRSPCTRGPSGQIRGKMVPKLVPRPAFTPGLFFLCPVSWAPCPRLPPRGRGQSCPTWVAGEEGPLAGVIRFYLRTPSLFRTLLPTPWAGPHPPTLMSQSEPG